MRKPLVKRSALPYANAALAAVVVLIVGMMIVPLPTEALDLLITSNLSLAVLILLVAFYIKNGLELAAFPTILLITTLYRLALNVSSTRLILLQADAGDVISSFGDFVVQGNYVVGAVVFLVITIVQFVVVARGSERVAEVGARFTLDAMPGRQLSIDAEVRAGTIDAREATEQRLTLRRESEFYGAMDGAMKFVKGDAIVGLVITTINIGAGLAIGIGGQGLGILEALQLYGMLTIGDGLVSQIPALLIATSAGLVVTRVASENADGSLASDVAEQLFGRPRALLLAGAILFLLALVPGLPTVPFTILAACLLALGTWQLRAHGRKREEHPAAHGTFVPGSDDLTVELDLGLSQSLGGTFLEKVVPPVRTRLFDTLGLPLPPVRLLTSAEDGEGYAFWVKGVPAFRAQVPEGADPELELQEALEGVARQHAAELFGMQRAQELLDQIAKTHPALVRQVVPRRVDLAGLTATLRGLLAEGVSIRPLDTILETIAGAPGETSKNTQEVTRRRVEAARLALSRPLTFAHTTDGILKAHVLDPMVEEAIRDSIRESSGEKYLAMPPELANEITEAIGATGASTLLTQRDLRPFVRQLLRPTYPAAAVLAYEELDPSIEVDVLGSIRP